MALCESPSCLDDHVAYTSWMFPDGTLWANFYRIPNGYLIQFPDIAEFYCTRQVSCQAFGSTSDETCQHLLVNQVQPLLRSLDGTLVLHASSICASGMGAVFIAQTGFGKSTLATSFGQHGAEVLGDDSAVLRRSDSDIWEVEPGHRSVRLWEDSGKALLDQDIGERQTADFTAKMRFIEPNTVSFSPGNRPLSAVFHLGPPDDDNMRVRQLSERDAFARLIEHQFVLDDQDKAALTRRFDATSDLTRDVPHFLLSYPRRYNQLADVRELILTTLRGVSGDETR